MWSDTMTEFVNAGNALARALLQIMAPSLPGAHVGELCVTELLFYLTRRPGLFDSYALFSDMLARPQDFLNGTAPLNITGAVHECVLDLNESTSRPARCTDAVGTDRDSFLWYVRGLCALSRLRLYLSRFDELHPSEQADRQVAKAIAAAINRKTEQFTTWFS